MLASERSSPPNQIGRLRRSEEHTSELQSQSNLVCRLLLEKKRPARGRAGEGGDDRRRAAGGAAHHAAAEAPPRARPGTGPSVVPVEREQLFHFLVVRRPPKQTPFPYTTLFRS